MVEKSDGKNWLAIFFSWFLILCFSAISALNIWLLLEFYKIKFTPQTKKSKAHIIVESLLWLLSSVPLFISVIVGGLIVWKGSTKMYQLPLVALIISLFIYSVIQMIISYFWRELQVIDVNDQNYQQVSKTILFSGYLTMPSVLIIIGIWFYISEKGPLGKFQALKRKYENEDCDTYKKGDKLTAENINKLIKDKNLNTNIDDFHKKATKCNKTYEELENTKNELMEKFGLKTKGEAAKKQMSDLKDIYDL